MASRQEQAKEREALYRRRMRERAGQDILLPDEKGIYIALKYDLDHGNLAADKIGYFKELKQKYG